MPRPRVRPEDRQRAPKACEPCKIAKKRCDSVTPCRTCVKKGIAPSCTYAMSRGRRGHGRGRWQEGQGGATTVSHSSSLDILTDGQSSRSRGDVERSSNAPSELQTPQGSEIPPIQSPLMLLSSSGENGMPPTDVVVMKTKNRGKLI